MSNKLFLYDKKVSVPGTFKDWSHSSLIACLSQRFLALCCGSTCGTTSGTSAGGSTGVLLVTLRDFLGGLFLSRPGVRGGETQSSLSNPSCEALRSPIMVEATRTRLSKEGAETKGGLYGDR